MSWSKRKHDLSTVVRNILYLSNIVFWIDMAWQNLSPVSEGILLGWNNIFLSFFSPFPFAQWLIVQLQTFCGEKKVIHNTSQNTFAFLWIGKCDVHVCSSAGPLASYDLPRCLPSCPEDSELFCFQQNFSLSFPPLHAQSVSSFS